VASTDSLGLYRDLAGLNRDGNLDAIPIHQLLVGKVQQTGPWRHATKSYGSEGSTTINRLSRIALAHGVPGQASHIVHFILDLKIRRQQGSIGDLDPWRVWICIFNLH
jgi:hypothetical protein